MIEFTVHGIPKPAGSKRAFLNPKTKRIVVTDDCKTGRDWKASMQAAAIEAMAGDDPATGPLGLHVTFWMPRPKSHYRKDGTVKESAPDWHDIRPDATKLLRCAEDAMTGIVWRDDAQVVSQEVTKRYADGSPRAVVRVWRIDAWTVRGDAA